MPAYQFTVEQAEQILARKAISLEVLKAELATYSLKEVAAKYKIGHVRLSACAHALGAYSTSKEDKIAAKLTSISQQARIHNEETVNNRELISDLQNLTFSSVLKKHKVTTEWLTAFCNDNSIVPLTRQDVNSLLSQQRKEKTEQALIDEYSEELMSALQSGQSIRSIASQLHSSKRTINRLVSKIYPQYFDEERTSERQKKHFQEAGSKGVANQKKAFYENALDKSEKVFSNTQLSHFVFQELNSYNQLATHLNIQPHIAKKILRERLEVEFTNDLSSRMFFARKILAKDTEYYNSRNLEWVEPFLAHFQIEVPSLFHLHPALYALNELEKDQTRLQWLIDLLDVKDKKHLTLLLPGYNEAKTFYLLQSLYPEKVSITVDRFGKERKVFALDNDPLPATSLVQRSEEKKDLLKKFTSSDGIVRINEAAHKARTQSEFYSLLGLSQSQAIALRAAKVLPITKFVFSSQELSIKAFLDTLEVKYQTHVTSILPNKRQELDFYLPDLKLAIEINPTYTHNSTYGWGYKPENAISPQYHQNKVNEARKAGITLIMLYEKDLTEPNFSNITLPFLKFKILGADFVYYARQVNLELLTKSAEIKEARSFIAKYHSQGTVPAQHYFGFKDKKSGKLIGVCSFGKNSFLVKGETHMELKRMVFQPGVQVRFGLSKVVNHFFKSFGHQWSSLYSYSKNDMGEGTAYSKAGFDFVRETEPGLMYVNPADPYDTYSWSINSSWGAKQGILYKHFLEEQLQTVPRRELIINYLPRRTGNGKGYVEIYNSGSKLWKIEGKP